MSENATSHFHPWVLWVPTGQHKAAVHRGSYDEPFCSSFRSASLHLWGSGAATCTGGGGVGGQKGDSPRGSPGRDGDQTTKALELGLLSVL